jgi:hypothetical protein
MCLSRTGVGIISTSSPKALNFETSNSSSFLSFPGGLLVSTWITSETSAAALEPNSLPRTQ